MNFNALRNKTLKLANNVATAVQPPATAAMDWVGKHPKTTTVAVTAVAWLSNRGNKKRAAAYLANPTAAVTKDTLGYIGLASSVYDLASLIGREMSRRESIEKAFAEAAKAAEELNAAVDALASRVNAE